MHDDKAPITYLIGTDEAGYGPNLGPLVISTAVWQVPHGVRARSFTIGSRASLPRIAGAGFRVQGSGFRVQGLAAALVPRFRIQSRAGYPLGAARVQGSGFRKNTAQCRFQISNHKSQIRARLPIRPSFLIPHPFPRPLLPTAYCLLPALP